MDNTICMEKLYLERGTYQDSPAWAPVCLCTHSDTHMPFIMYSCGGICVVRQKGRLARIAAYIKDQKEKRCTNEPMLNFFLRADRQKPLRSKEEGLAHPKYMY